MGPGLLSAATEPRAQSGLLDDAGLARRGSSLAMGDVVLADIARAVGTPAYVYNAAVIREHYRALDRAMHALPHRICYAVKANGNLGVLRILRDLGAGADIVSAGELARALAAGFPPDRIVFSGVGKTAAELGEAISAGVGHINVESREELELLGRLADADARQVSVGIRVNPDVTAETHPYISTGQSGIKFGVPIDHVPAAAAFVASHPRLRLDAIAMHLGSQITSAAPFREGAERLVALLRRLAETGVRPRAIDVGGGLGIRYSSETPLEPARLAEALAPVLGPTGLTVYLEPGRYLVGSAGVLLATALYRKHSGGKDFVIVDAGMNDLVRPSHYQAYHEIVELEARGRERAVVDVVGPVCETGDFLALDRRLPGIEPGEQVAVLGAGAYGFAMASNYNSRPRPAEVIVDGDRWWVARPRESVDALFASEQLTP